MLHCAPIWLGPARGSTVTRFMRCSHFTTCSNQAKARPSLLKGLWRHSLTQPSLRQFSRLRHAPSQPVPHINSSAQAAAAADTSPAPLALPDYCAGCGVKLQEEDADRPGWDASMLLQAFPVHWIPSRLNRQLDSPQMCRYFKVPKKLLEPEALQVTL